MTLQRCFNNCCVEEKPASALHNLPWGEEEKVFSFIRVTHTNPWPIWPAFKRHSLGLSNAGVQTGYGESGSGSRAGSLVLELKAQLKGQWAELLSWMRMAFMQASRGEETAAFTLLLATGNGFSECVVQLVSSLCSQHHPSSKEFAKSSRPWVQGEEGNVPNPGKGRSCADLSKTCCIIELWDLERRFKKILEDRGMVLGRFPTVHYFFSHHGIAARTLSLVLICSLLSWFQKTVVNHTAVQQKLLNF